MAERGWKIGELAKRVGLTVRMLHHYDRIGLFSPSRHTESGHRLYTVDDLKKLQQIVSLKQLGFHLQDIKTMLHNPDYDPMELLLLQLSRFDEQIRTLTELRHRLLQIYDQYRTGKIGSSEQFMTVIRMMNMMQSPHFTDKQIDALRERFSALGGEPYGEAAGQRIIAEFRKLRRMGKSPDDPDVLALARRWKQEMDALSLTDPELVRSAEQYYKENPDEGLYYGMDKELYLYMKKALSLI